MSSCYGIDTSAFGGGRAICRADETSEFIDSDRKGRANHATPAVVVTNESGQFILRTTLPYEPLGTGCEWPPEAQAGADIGSRRMPLCLSIGALELSSDEKRGIRDEWSWPVFAAALGRKTNSERITELLRSALSKQSTTGRGDEPETLALAIPSALSLSTQSKLLLLDKKRPVRLCWRSVAAFIGAMGPWDGSQQTTAFKSHKDHAVLHIHLGLDGFEATRLTLQHHRGDLGPKLLVPSRSRRQTSNTCSSPLRGLRVLADYLRASGIERDEDLWAIAFGCSSAERARRVAESERSMCVAVAEGGGAQNDCRAGWRWAKEPVRPADNEKWERELEEVIAGCSGDECPAFALVSGELSQPDGFGGRGRLAMGRPLDAVRRVLQDRRIEMSIAGADAIASGAAIFASRQQRGWATYLDQLPRVEIVVQKNGEPHWQEVFEGKHYDAGKSVRVELKNFRIAAGSRRMEIPAIVDGFETVRRTGIEFTDPTEVESPVVITVDVQAASGLPIVVGRAVHAQNAEAALDWETADDTHESREHYLATVPRAFPPSERRQAGAWWTTGEDNKGKYVYGEYKSCDELCDLLCAAITNRRRSDIDNYKTLLLEMARQRSRNADNDAWIWGTDGNGRNSKAKSLRPLYDVLRGEVEGAGVSSDRSGKALRILGWLHCQDAPFMKLLRESCSLIPGENESSALVHAIGECLSRPDDCAVAIKLLAPRIRLFNEDARRTGEVPKGINTLRAVGSLFANWPSALEKITNECADDLANSIAQFIELSVKNGRGYFQKFNMALRAVLFLLRRREWQASFLPPESQAFRIVVRYCAIVYVDIFVNSDIDTLYRKPRAERIRLAKEFAEKLWFPGSQREQQAQPTTRRIIAGLDASLWHDASAPTSGSPDKVLERLVEIIKYIEGRGSGIVLMDS